MTNDVQNKPKWRWSKSSKGTNCVCTHHGRTNQTIKTCFAKHSYPPGFKKKAKASQSSLGDQSTYNNDYNSA